MAIFKKKPQVQNLGPELAALRQRAEALDAKRRAADAELTSATEARQHHLVEGDLSDVKTAQTLQDAVNVAASQLVALGDALGVVHAQITDVEQKLDAERKQAARNSAADALSSNLDEIERVLPDYLAASRRFFEAVGAVGHFHFGGGQIGALAQNSYSEIDSAMPIAMAELRRMVNEVRDGRAPIPPRKPDPARSAAATRTADPVAAPASSIKYAPLKYGPRYRGPVPPADPVLAAAGFRVLDRSSEAREIKFPEPRGQ